MMNGAEKSDSAIGAKKPANKAGLPAAERVEQRAGTEGNAGQPRTYRTQSRLRVSPGLDRVRTAARQRKKESAVAQVRLGSQAALHGYLSSTAAFGSNPAVHEADFQNSTLNDCFTQ